ncbi:Type I Iterative PKS [Apiospora arundinis]
MPLMYDASEATPQSEPIAVIGIALRAPGDGSDPEKFWNMLLEGRSARCAIPEDRYNVAGFYHPDGDRLGSIQQRHAHFLKQDFKVFDAPFFSVTPKEAKAMVSKADLSSRRNAGDNYLPIR